MASNSSAVPHHTSSHGASRGGREGHAPRRVAGHGAQRSGILAARDAQVCRNCGHRCAAHGSVNRDGQFIGIGRAACGMDGCRCRRMRGRYFFSGESRFRPIDAPQAGLRMLALAGRSDRRTAPVQWSDDRTSMDDLRSAMVLDNDDVGTYRLCPTGGYDLATAVYGLPWCCAAGRHPGLTPRRYRVRVVTVEHDPELDLTVPVLELVEDVDTVLPPHWWDAWHDWTAARVLAELRSRGGLWPERKLDAFTVDVERTSRSTGFHPLGRAVELRLEGTARRPVTNPWWRDLPSWDPHRHGRSLGDLVDSPPSRDAPTTIQVAWSPTGDWNWRCTTPRCGHRGAGLPLEETAWRQGIRHVDRSAHVPALAHQRLPDARVRGRGAA